MKLLYCFLVLGLLGALSAVAEEVPSNDGTNQPTKDDSAMTARGRFVLPKIFDFNRYKELFKKSYSSVVEELARQKLFLSRAFNSVITMVKYKYEKLDYYLGVNQFSDQSPEELKRRRLSARQVRNQMADNDSEEVQSGAAKQEEHASRIEELPAADIDDIKRVIEEVKQHKDEPGYREIAKEFEQTEDQVRSKRDTEIAQISMRKISMDDLIPKESDILGDVSTRIERVPSNNPLYEPIELTSYGADDSQSMTSPLPSSAIKMISMVPGSKFISSIVNKAANVFSSSPKKSKPVQPDSIRVDHRLSGCFNTVRSQADCGSCYAFTAIAFFEWLYCMQTGRRVEFSEQYMIDCGKYAKLLGCNGGGEDKAARFVHKFGLHLRSDYPYLQREDECPYEPGTMLQETGYIRMKSTGYKYIKLDYIDEYLLERPIMAGMKLSEDFHFYSGGVHDNVGCIDDDAHLMLMVGDGIQDGKSYYLFRNSHSIAWGERGYYKVSKEAFLRCATDPVVGISTGNFSPSDRRTVNPLFNPEIISVKKNRVTHQK